MSAQLDVEKNASKQQNQLVDVASGAAFGLYNEKNDYHHHQLQTKNDGQMVQLAETQIKPSFKRYIVLTLFCLSGGNKAFQWIQIPASQEKVTYFYSVDNYVINAMSVLFMLAFIFLSWPACYIIRRLGIRNAVLLATFGACLGSIIKCFSCYEGGIYLLFVGQILVSCSEQLIFSIPSRLASVWFPDHQVSTAVSITVLGNHLGVAIGFVVPQIFLESTQTKEEIGQGLFGMFLLTAIISVIIFIGTVFFFDEAPKHAPGAARLKQLEAEVELQRLGSSGFITEMSVLLSQMLDLMKNRHICALALSYGIILGATYSLHTLLSQLLDPLWPENKMLVGNTGFIIIIGGALGSPLWGRLMDKVHRYLFINLFLSLGAVITCAAFGYAVCATHSALSIYLTALVFGAFSTGFVVSGLELAVELTYPAPELVTSSLMNVVPQIFGSSFVFIASYIVDTYGAFTTSIFFSSCFFIALMLLLTITESLKRQNAVLGTEKTQDVV